MPRRQARHGLSSPTARLRSGFGKFAGARSGLIRFSFPDYRDEKCLTFALTIEDIDVLQAKLGADPATALIGKKVRASGWAERNKIWYFSNGVKTDRFYYQTKVRVRDVADLEILPAP